MSTQDDDLMATLTDEERAAMADDTDDETGASDLGTNTPGEDDDGDDDADDASTSDAPPIEGKAASQAKPEPEPEPEPEPKAKQPRYEADLPADYGDRIQSIKDKDAEARQQFKNGEIDIDERDQILDSLRDEREELLVQRARAATLSEVNAQDDKQVWMKTVESFAADVARMPTDQGGIDYSKDGDALADFDREVKALAANPRHADKEPRWFLEAAHRRVMGDRGVVFRSVSAPTTAKPTAKAASEQRSASAAIKAAASASLANVPGGEGPGDLGGNEFADVLALEGEEYHDAIARMSPRELEKFKRFA